MALPRLGSQELEHRGISRREALRAGAGISAAVWPASFASLAAGAPAQPGETVADDGQTSIPGFGKAKRVLFLFLYGAASQHETWDPKPQAPAEVRGPFQAIDTAVPGLQFSENFPRLAKLADRLTCIRSMTHPFPIHSSAYTMTGIDKVDIPMELGPYEPRHWPFFGSVLDYLEQRRHPQAPPPGLPRNMALPFLFSSREQPFKRGGPYGGFLGRGYNPVWTEFEGRATRALARMDSTGDGTVADPFCGITPDSRFFLPQGDTVTLDRLHKRRSLLTQLDNPLRNIDPSAVTQSLDHYQRMAYSLLGSPVLREALDVQREPADVRERYGMTLFGQATLAGRRLLEAGAKVVTVIWDEYTVANTAWDIHNGLVPRMRDELGPGLDRALSAVLVDLEERGMLEETLVMCLTEHGRTPKVVSYRDLPGEAGTGRDHWSDVYSNLLAGGGIARGRVVGSSDKHGAFVKEGPVSPKDILCTMYHLLGINPHSTIPDRLNRPVPLVSGGEIQARLLG